MIVREAHGASDFEAVARLMRAFIDWHYERHSSDRHIIDSYFDPEKFADELANLPGQFAPPRGRLLVAEAEDGAIAGCVALRDLGSGACEMKRMFVDSAFHGQGLGMLLGLAIVEDARAMGYERILLDTGPGPKGGPGPLPQARLRRHRSLLRLAAAPARLARFHGIEARKLSSPPGLARVFTLG